MTPSREHEEELQLNLINENAKFSKKHEIEDQFIKPTFGFLIYKREAVSVKLTAD